MEKTTVSEKIQRLIKEWELILAGLPEEILTNNKNSQNRTIKQIVGHMIDSASNNHQRMVRLHYNEYLDFPDYRQDNDRWIAIQKYQDENWENLVQLWKFFNLHIAHIINQADEQQAGNKWVDCEGITVSLDQMTEGYYDHLLLHLMEIQELIK
jgi:hypothetical protein